jgi:hypothetical protein
LTLVFDIALAVSTPAVVQKVISMLSPMELRYTTELHPLVVRKLGDLFLAAKRSPPVTASLRDKISFSQVPRPLDFTFVTWMWIESPSCPNILTAEAFVKLSIVNQFLMINNTLSHRRISLKSWFLLAVSHCQGDEVQVYINDFMITVPEIPTNNNLVPCAFSVGDENCCGRFAAYGFQYLDLANFRSLFSTGPWHSPNCLFDIEGCASAHSEFRNFASVFLQSFKIEVLLPLYAQLDFPLKTGLSGLGLTAIDITRTLAAALEISPDYRREFVCGQGFAIVAHLLLNASPSHLSHDLYQYFYRLYDALGKEVKDEVAKDILLNFALWVPARSQDQQRILDLMVKTMKISVSDWLLHLRIFYWYKPVDVSQIVTSRAADLDVKACRAIVFFGLGNHGFSESDFRELVDHCLTGLDFDQRCELLAFMSDCPLKQPLPGSIIDSVRFLFNHLDDETVVLALKAIVNLHRRHLITGLSLPQLLKIVFAELVGRQLRSKALGELICTVRFLPELFEFCSYFAMQSGDLELYRLTEPQTRCCCEKSWAFWAITQATAGDFAEIIQFLILCDPHEWMTLFGTITIVCGSQHRDVWFFRNSFLIRVCNYVMGNQTELEVVRGVFRMIQFSVITREKFSHSEGLMNCFADSPFREQLSGDCEATEIDDRTAPCTFGLHVSADGRWKDQQLARLALGVWTQYPIRRFMEFILFLAGHLGATDPRFVATWLADRLADLRFTPDEWARLGEHVQFVRQKSSMALVSPAVFHQVVSGPSQFFDSEMCNQQLKLHAFMARFCSEGEQIYSRRETVAFRKTLSDIDLRLQEIMLFQQESKKAWQRLWTNAAAIGGPWCSYDQAKLIRWKRDPTLCAFYCPMKLKRNRHFDTHMKASLTRELGSAGTAEQIARDHHKNLLATYIESAPPAILHVSETPDVLCQSVSATELLRTATHRFDVTAVPPIPTKQNLPEADLESSKWSAQCELIKHAGHSTGTFSLHSAVITIVLEKPKKRYLIPIASIERLFQRRRFHIPTAIELFLRDGRSYFINFPQLSSHEIVQRLVKVLPNSVAIQRTQKFGKYLRELEVTEQWCQHKMSNFHYLVQLNILSGRSFTDHSQYPFFPWVIADYTSDALDLSSAATFRDLTKPIGRLGNLRFEELCEKCAELEAVEGCRYYYSSFVICPLSLYMFLIRSEPFTTLHIEMQGQRFDSAGRVFASISDSWRFATSHINNYRELPPEFYSTWDFLVNANDFDLGEHNSVRIGDCILPPWAHGSPPLFVYLMRKALESDFVSRNLHSWIDLTWGFAQRGPDAERAGNVYRPDLYDTVWTEQNRKNPAQRAAIETSLCHVGQVPPQLFSSPHPHRRVCIRQTVDFERKYVALNEMKVDCAFVTRANDSECLVRVATGRRSACYQATVGGDLPVVSEFDGIEFVDDVVEFPSFEHVLLRNGILVEIKSRMVVCTQVSLVACDGGYFAVVHDDSSLQLIGPGVNFAVPFYGEIICCCAISRAFKMVVCGTRNEHVVIVSLFDGTKVSVFDVEDVPERVAITRSWGFIVIAEGTRSLAIYDVNGRELRRADMPLRVACWHPWTSHDDFDYLLLATGDGKVYATEVFFAEIGEPICRLHMSIAAIAYFHDVGLIMLVGHDGKLVYVPEVL